MTWFAALRRRIRGDKRGDAPESDAGPVRAEFDHGQVGIRTDNPIRQPGEGTLGRRKIAHTFAQQVLSLDVSEGVVVVLRKPRARRVRRAGIPILDFNPWMFSGAKQLVDSFFVEMAAQLKIRPGLVHVGKGLEEYGETFSGISWLPFVGP